MKFKVFIRTAGIPEYEGDEIIELETENQFNMPTRLLHVPIRLNRRLLGTFTFKLVGLADGAPYYMYTGRRKKNEELQRGNVHETDSDFDLV